MEKIMALFLKGRGFVLWGASLFIACLVFGGLSFMLSFACFGGLIYLFPTVYPTYFPTLAGAVVTVVAIVATVFWWTTALQTVPIGSRGQILVLGQRLTRKEGDHEEGVGVEEGLRALPLPPPFFALRVEDVREKSLQLFGSEKGEDGRRKSNIVVLTKDGVKAVWYATLQYAVTRPARFLMVDQSVIDQGLVGSTVEAFRRFTLQFSSADLIEKLTEVIRDPDFRPELTDKEVEDLSLTPEERRKTFTTRNLLLIRETMEEMGPDVERWGIEIRKVIPGNVRFPESVEKAFSMKVIEEREADAEMVQANGQAARVKILRGDDTSLSLSEAYQIDGDERGKRSSRQRIIIDGTERDPLTRAAATLGSLYAEKRNSSESPPDSPANGNNTQPPKPKRN